MTEHPAPLVSAIIIFLNEERFLGEAIAGVQGQTNESWELLLVDDGSTDSSSEIAKAAAAADPDRIRYLTHPDGANRGMSASRNLGIAHAYGWYIAFCDGDDFWLPGKLERQTDLAGRHPKAAMVIAPLLRWRRWSESPGAVELEDVLGVGRRKFGRHPYAGRLVDPPAIARLMLEDDYFIPGGALIQRRILDEVGGYHNEFRSMYEDAVVMMKIASRYPVYVDDKISYLYRMHPDSCTSTESTSSTVDSTRSRYLEVSEQYLAANGLLTPWLEEALSRSRLSTYDRRHRPIRLLNLGRAIGRTILPRSVRDLLRKSWRSLTRPEVPCDV